MKKLACLLIAGLLAGCSSTHGLIETSWTPIQLGIFPNSLLTTSGNPKNPMPSIYGMAGPIVSGGDDLIGVGAGLAILSWKCYGIETGMFVLNFDENYGVEAGLIAAAKNNYDLSIGGLWN